MMSINAKLTALAMASATLIAFSSAQASPIFYDDKGVFLGATSGESLAVQDFETLENNSPPGVRIGVFTMESAFDIDRAFYGTNGPKAVKIDEDDDAYIKFTFDAPITAFGITIIDALDHGGGSIWVTVDGHSPVEFIGPLPDQPDLNERFLGITDTDGFTMVTIVSTDSSDLVFYDDMLHTMIAEPATIALFGLGLVALGTARRKRLV
jgi:hypothetical protein